MTVTKATRRLLAAPLLVVVLALALLNIGTTGASASPACEAGSVCVWVDGPFVGNGYPYPGNRNHWDLRAEHRDRVSSWSNQTNATWCLVDYVDGNPNLRVELDRLAPGDDRGGLTGGRNDRADAIQRC